MMKMPSCRLNNGFILPDNIHGCQPLKIMSENAISSRITRQNTPRFLEDFGSLVLQRFFAGGSPPGVSPPGVSLPGVSLPEVSPPGVLRPGFLHRGFLRRGFSAGGSPPGVSPPGVSPPGVLRQGFLCPTRHFEREGCTTRKCNILHLPRVRTEVAKNSFYYGLKILNSLSS